MKTNEQNSVAYYHAYRYSIHSASINRPDFKMNGARRVVIFCLLTAVLPTILIIIPLYLRHNVFADVVYEVAESDILEIGDDISTIFCQDHTIKMNTTFSSYQVDSKPEISNTRKHIRLKKSMRLPDDTLEYWGFFLPKGSTVRLSVCSRYDGSRILVVRGEKNLRTCGLLDHSKVKDVQPTTVISPSVGQGQVRVRFELDPEQDLPLSVVTSSTIAPQADDGATSDDPNLSNIAMLKDSSTRQSRSADEDKNAAEEEVDDGLRTFFLVSEYARKVNEARVKMEIKPRTAEEAVTGHRLRHSRSRSARSERAKANGEEERRRKRRAAQPIQPHNLDAKVMHGGNAGTHIDSDESSTSSFEIELLNCYGGDILLTQGFPQSPQCVNVTYLLTNQTGRMTTTHNVNEDGYYYYIFYSDNDFVENDIHAVFDIYKPTYQLANITKNCINQTSCTFPVAFLSSEVVIVEVPTKDGIEHEEEDLSTLVSVCHPRMSVYIIFPLLVLILILGCAFL